MYTKSRAIATSGFLLAAQHCFAEISLVRISQCVQLIPIVTTNKTTSAVITLIGIINIEGTCGNSVTDDTISKLINHILYNFQWLNFTSGQNQFICVYKFGT